MSSAASSPDIDTAARARLIGTTVTLLAVAAFFSGAALRMCDALIPRFAADFAVTTGVAGRVVISFSVAYGLMQIVFGPLADRFGKPQVMAGALLGCAVGAGACALAADFHWLVALRIVWGASAAGVIPLGMAWIGDMVPYEQRQATLARLLTGTLSGMMLGQLAGGLFADSSFGWRGAFVLATVGYVVVGAFLMSHLLRQPAPAAVADGKGHRGMVANLVHVVAQPWARVVLLATAAEGMFLLGPLAYIPAYLHQRHHISIAAAAALAALYAVGGLVYAMTVRKVVARWGEQRMALFGGLFMGGGFAAWWWLPSWELAGAVALMVGYGTYLYHNTLQTHATQMVPSLRGTAMALFAMCLFGGQAIGVSLAGFVVDRAGFVPMLAISTVVMPVAGVLFSRALRRRAAAA